MSFLDELLKRAIFNPDAISLGQLVLMRRLIAYKRQFL